MTVKERLKAYLKAKKISEREFAEKINVSNGYVSAMRTSIPPDKLTSIAKHFPDLSHEWLLLGVGQMIKEDQERGVKKDGIEIAKDKSESVSSGVWQKFDDKNYKVKVDVISCVDLRNYLKSYMNILINWEQITFSVSTNLRTRGYYLGFRHSGDAMFNHENPSFYDIKDGMPSLAREHERWRWEKTLTKNEGRYGWILITKDAILHADITSVDFNAGMIKCAYRNPDTKYSDFDLELNDVYQIFKIITVNH